MEDWESKADDGLNLFPEPCHQYKKRSPTAKPIIPMLQYSSIPRHIFKAQQNFSELARKPSF